MTVSHIDWLTTTRVTLCPSWSLKVHDFGRGLFSVIGVLHAPLILYA